MLVDRLAPTLQVRLRSCESAEHLLPAVGMSGALQ